jgi:hypothetical protein
MANLRSSKWLVLKRPEVAGFGRPLTPNRPDDEEYIARLVGQVVRVSLETVRIVDTLPAAFTDGGETTA